jgi:excisionase family DNA binding protein
MTDHPRRWLTITQAAEVLQIHPKTAYSWALTGRLPTARIGGSRKAIRVDRVELERRLERQIAEGHK